MRYVETAVAISLDPTLAFLTHLFCIHKRKLWEMACARNIGLTDIPIVVVNVDDYYTPFREQLERSYVDELIKLKPNEVVHFVHTAEDAVRWIEDQAKTDKQNAVTTLKRRDSVMRSTSFMASPLDWFRSSSPPKKTWGSKGMLVDSKPSLSAVPTWALTFAAGLVLGITVSSAKSVKA
jgi:hypothetical protein